MGPVPRPKGAFGAVGVLGIVAALTSCKDPFPFDAKPVPAGTARSASTANEDCPADPSWLPADGGPPPPLQMFTPPPHPDTECPFYRGAYQSFLIVATPDANGDPALVHYATLDDAFTSAKTHLVRNTGDPSADPYANPSGVTAAARVRTGPPTGRAWLGAVRQAGQRNVLVDRDHHSLFYGLHMNDAFVDFIKENGLNTVQGILDVNPALSFPPGLVEFKTAWKDIDPHDFPNKSGQLGTADGIVPPPGDGPIFMGDPGDYSNYITTMAWLPWLSQDPATHVIDEDPDHPVLRKVALVAIHCVYTLPGHPEFVWGSIQHVNVNVVDPAPVAYAGVPVLGAPDTQPDTTGSAGMPALPSNNDPQNSAVTLPPSMNDYLLYKGGTAENAADQAIADRDLMFDEPTQSFPGQVTSVYRMFPGSKSNALSPDTAVFSLNSNIDVLFANAAAAQSLAPKDKRVNYRLVAAVWMDKPALFGLGPNGQGMSLQNDDTNPLVIGAGQKPPNTYPNVSQGNFCGTPLDATNTSGDSPEATGMNNTVPGCSTRADDLARGDNPSVDFATHKVGTDSEFSILGGEDRLSSTAMESFTQNGTFHNCFACHNTEPISTNGTPYVPNTGLTPLLTKPALINVSHLFSEFVLREQAGL
jgi:hypothetical protein